MEKEIDRISKKLEESENLSPKQIEKLEKELEKNTTDLNQVNSEIPILKEKTREAVSAHYSKKIESLTKELENLVKQNPGNLQKIKELTEKVDEARSNKDFAEKEEMTIIAEFKAYKGTFKDGDTIGINPYESNLTELNRPGGFARGGETEIKKDTYKKASEQVFSNDKRKQDYAVQIIETWGDNEGKADSLNTWDVAKLTLGPGIAARGVLQQAFSNFNRNEPDEFQTLFGRFGIGVTAGTKGPDLTVVVPRSLNPIQQNSSNYSPGQLLKGDEAIDFIINDPVLLLQLVKAGKNEKWQKAMSTVVIKTSIETGAFNFKVSYHYNDSQTGKQSIQKILWDQIVDSLEEKIKVATYASLADEAHAKGSAYTCQKNADDEYSKQVKQNNLDGRKPELLSKASRLEMARSVLKNVPPHRRKAFEKAISGFKFSDVGL